MYICNVYLRKRVREGQREERESPSRLHKVSTQLDVGIEVMNHEIMTSAEIKSWKLNQLGHPGAQ